MHWREKHGHNLDWFLRLSAQGVKVKALENLPTLEEIDKFYLKMYTTCGANFQSIVNYCDLYSLAKGETLEAIDILNKINSRV